MSQNQIPVEQLREGSSAKKVIGVVSGKGGVGKSSVTGLTAVLANRCGYRTAVMDADITGPSIPKMFGLHQNAESDGAVLYPVETKNGIKVISLNLLVKNETDPVVWRGPMVANVVKQFWKDVAWGDVDFMMIDMPPGTGDVPLTVFQSIPVDGIIVVASPQDLVGMIVEKAINMANMMNIPILGLVENMSYLECPDCGEHIKLFGESHIDEIAKEKGLTVLGKLPIQPEFAGRCDDGTIEDFAFDWLDSLKSVFGDMVSQSETAASSVPTTKSSNE